MWGFRDRDRQFHSKNDMKESSSLYTEEKESSSFRAASGPLIFHPPKVKDRQVMQNDSSEKEQEGLIVEHKDEKDTNWDELRLAIAAEESPEAAWESKEEQEKEEEDDIDEFYFSGDESEEEWESSENMEACMDDHLLAWLEPVPEAKCEQQESLGSYPYSRREEEYEESEKRIVHSFTPGGSCRRHAQTEVKLPVCLATVDVDFQLFRTIDLPLSVMQLNQVEWKISTIKGKVVLPSNTVFLKLTLTATLEVVCDDRLQQLKIDVPVERTLQADWKHEPVVPFSDSAEYMFQDRDGDGITLHRESFHKFAEEVQFDLYDFHLVSHDEIVSKVSATCLMVKGDGLVTIDLLQPQYVILA